MSAPTFPGDAVTPKRPALVTVIIPAFNAADTLGETLESLCRQTYSTWEAVIIDDGSTDATQAIARSWCKRDGRIRLVQQANRGVASARNRAISESAGDFIAPLDADDLWHAEKLQAQMSIMQLSASKLGLVYTDFVFIDENSRIQSASNRTMPKGDVATSLVRRNFIGNASSALMPRSVVLECGAYDERLKAQGGEGCEDWLLSIRIASRYPVDVAALPLVGYRVRARSMSSNALRMFKSCRLVGNAVLEQHPDWRPHVRWGEATSANWLLKRSLRERDWNAATRLAGAMLRKHPGFFFGKFVPDAVGKMAPWTGQKHAMNGLRF